MTRPHTKLAPLACGMGWPGGAYVEVAKLSLTDADLIDYFGRDLVSGDEPGLGPWRAIGLQSGSGAVAELICHEAEQTRGFTLRVDVLSDPRAVFDEIVAELLPGREGVLWRRPRGPLP